MAKIIIELEDRVSKNGVHYCHVTTWGPRPPDEVGQRTAAEQTFCVVMDLLAAGVTVPAEDVAL